MLLLNFELNYPNFYKINLIVQMIFAEKSITYWEFFHQTRTWGLNTLSSASCGWDFFSSHTTDLILFSQQTTKMRFSLFHIHFPNRATTAKTEHWPTVSCCQTLNMIETGCHQTLKHDSILRINIRICT